MSALRRFGLVLGLGVLALLLLSAALFTPVVGVRAPHSAYNPGPDGLSSFAADLYGRSLLAPSVRIEDGRAGVDTGSFARHEIGAYGTLVVVAPLAGPDEAERAWIRAFVGGGGLLVVAGSGPASSLFLGTVTDTRVEEAPVRDPSYSRSLRFPLVRTDSDDPLLAGVSNVILGRPGIVRPGPSAEIVSTTTTHSFVDLDGDGWPSPGEPRGPFPWLVRERVGEGEVLVLSDAEVLTNGLRAAGDDGRLADNLVALLATRGRVLLDEGHRGEQAPLALLDAGLQRVPAWVRLGSPLAAYAALLFLVARRRPSTGGLRFRLLERLLREPRPEPPTRAAVKAELLRRHPEWDSRRLDGILDRLEAGP